MSMNIKTKGFTLTELLVALGVVGVLAAILMPVVRNIMPNQDVIMAKKAYYMVQTAVSELINDPNCYPDKTQAPGSEKRVGFDDGYGYENCPWGNNEIPDTAQYIETEGSAESKFAALLKNKLGNDDTWVVGTDHYGDRYTIPNGMQFWISHPAWDTPFYLYIDVNGQEKGSNCGIRTHGSSCKNPDIFTIDITNDGGVTINAVDTWAIEAVKVTHGVN